MTAVADFRGGYFDKASLLVFGPGEQLYSCAGHIAFRLECPHYKLDNVFSYEGENAADIAVSPVDKVITPDDLLEYLRRIRVEGRPVLTAEPVDLLPQTLHANPPLVTPLAAAWAVVALVIVGCFWARRPIGVGLGALYVALAVAETYIVFVSDLPASDWNWLIVPFNPLPLVFWRWRRWWGRWAAAGLAVWALVMALAPHQLTDPAFVVLALGFAVGFVGLWYNRPR